MEDSASIASTEELLSEARKLDCCHRVTICEYAFEVLPEVFSPRIFQDSQKFTEWVLGFAQEKRTILEVGPGCGALSVLLALSGFSVTAVDINPVAVLNTQINAEAYGVENAVVALEGSVYQPLQPRDRFDLIFWNAPFTYRTSDDLSLVERSVYDPRYIGLQAYLGDARRHLSENGELLLGFSKTHGNTMLMEEICTQYRWFPRLLFSQKYTEGSSGTDCSVELYNLVEIT